MNSKIILVSLMMISSFWVFSQKKGPIKASSVSKSVIFKEIPPLGKMQNIISAKGFAHIPGEKNVIPNTSVKGKGFPKGNDPLIGHQKRVNTTKQVPAIKSFEAHKGKRINDPTGAIGPNHYVYAFNGGFGIRDRNGRVMLEETSLSTVLDVSNFSSEDGDPIVIYDNFADRFVMMQLVKFPRPGISIAVSKGPDPIWDGWNVYTYTTKGIPDYPKLSIWSDGYYITSNYKKANPSDTSEDESIYVIERDKVLNGDLDAKMIGFVLPEVLKASFFSPGALNATGKTLPPIGTPCSIIYFQDDSWVGNNSKDHLNIWDISVDWTDSTNSTISQPKKLDTAPFDSVFNEGTFQNLEEYNSKIKVDALQGAMMYMTNYRRFSTHNSVVFNFVVDIYGDDSVAGIRWYELRQEGDNSPWQIHQEGTYVQPDGHSAFCGTMALDSQGNIGLGYTIVSSDIPLSLRYTGRMENDPLGIMTVKEGEAANGDTQIPFNLKGEGRYGDYAQMTIDPIDGDTFWYIGEYMKDTINTRKSHVTAFKLKPDTADLESPTTPLDLKALVTTDIKTILQWSASSDNVGVNGYDIIQDGKVVSTVVDTIAEITGLIKETTYDFKVVATDAGGNSAESNGLKVRTVATYEDSMAPIAPKNLVAYNISETTLELKWDAALDDIAVAKYIVLQDGKEIDTVASLKHKVTGLIIDTSYDFTIKAIDTNESVSENSEVLSVKTDEMIIDVIPPDQPRINHTYANYALGCKLVFTVSNDNIGVVEYKIWRNDEHIGSVVVDPDDYERGKRIEFQVTGMQKNEKYEFKVSAVDAAGLESTKSTPWLVHVKGIEFGSQSEDEIEECPKSKLMIFELTFDANPHEIYWELVNSDGVVLKSESYSIFNGGFLTDRNVIGKLPPGEYVLSVIDHGRDGLCCDEGSGFYNLSNTDGIIALGSQFEYLNSHHFCVIEDDSEGIEEGEVGEVEIGPDKCADTKLMITLDFDDNAEETSWLLRTNDNSIIAAKSYTSKESKKRFIEEVIVPADREYTFEINDSGQNGICCDVGTGSYTLSSKNGVIVSGGDFENTESTTFCVSEAKVEAFDLADNGFDTRFKLIPNPVSNILTITIDKIPLKKVEIFSMLGRLVFSAANQGFDNEIDVSGLESGTYFARIQSGKDVVTRKFVKK